MILNSCSSIGKQERDIKCFAELQIENNNSSFNQTLLSFMATRQVTQIVTLFLLWLLNKLLKLLHCFLLDIFLVTLLKGTTRVFSLVLISALIIFQNTHAILKNLYQCCIEKFYFMCVCVLGVADTTCKQHLI